MLKNPKHRGLKAAARQEFLTKIFRDAENRGFCERKLKKGGDITSVDIRQFLGSVRFEFAVFMEQDGCERIRIAKRRKTA